MDDTIHVKPNVKDGLDRLKQTVRESYDRKGTPLASVSYNTVIYYLLTFYQEQAS